MHYVVTGATGFVGRCVAQQLIEGGHRVNVIVRSPARAADLAALGITVYQGDVTDKDSMRPAMQGCDGVFHIAGWYKLGARDWRAGEAINVQGTRHVLELMRELLIPRGVYTSTLAIFSDTHGRMVDETYHYQGPHLSHYDESKWRAHYEVAEPMIAAGLPLTIVMPGLIYGPGDTSSVHTTLQQYLQRRLPMVPTGTAFCWGYIDDIARAHLLAMERGRPGESYIIAAPPHTLVDALSIAQQITGIPAPRLQLSPAVMRGMAGMMGLLERLLPLPPDYSAEYLRASGGTTYLGDNSKARRELGYDPRPLKSGLATKLQAELQLLG